MDRLFQSIIPPAYLLILFIILGLASTMAFGSGQLYVLDDTDKSITAISDDGDTMWKVQLKRKPDRMAISPSGNHLIVMDKGKGWESTRFGWVPTKKSSISVVDTNSLEITALPKVCWSVSVGAVERGAGVGGAWYFSRDGKRMVIQCEGQWATQSDSGVKKKEGPTSPNCLKSTWLQALRHGAYQSTGRLQAG